MELSVGLARAASFDPRKDCAQADRPYRIRAATFWTVQPDALMNAETVARLIEEMIDQKLQHYAESQLRPSAEVARILHEKRETDRRRLEQIRTEVVRMLKD